MSLPLSVKHSRLIANMRRYLSAHDYSFLCRMVERGEGDPSGCGVGLDNWLSGKPGHCTVFLRDELCPPIGEGRTVTTPPRYCTCCKTTHGVATSRPWDAFHDAPWIALDSARFQPEASAA